MFHKTCERWKDKTAFINMGAELSFDELSDYARDLSAFFQTKAGLKKGDAIAIQLPNVLQYPIAIFAALQAGLVVVNTNPLYTSREMKHQLVDSEAKAILILENSAHHLQEIIAHTQIKTVIVTGVGDLLGFPKSLLVNSVIKYVKKMVPSYEIKNHYTFWQALDLGRDCSFQPAPVDKEDLAFLQYTGGTTGVAKGAMLTHRNVLSNMLQIQEWMKPRLQEGKELVVLALPLYHIFSLTVNAFGIFSYGGTNLMITNPRDIPGFIKTLKQYKFSVFVGLNTLFNALLNHKDFLKVHFSSLKISVAGGMALQKAVSTKWKELTGSAIVEGYGLTETSPVACCNPVDGTDQVGTIGLPLPSTDIKLCDDEGIEVPSGQQGEIYVKGPQVMRGYWKKPEETQTILNPDGWIKTGDVGIIDKLGFIRIVDRKKDMILVSGFNVYPNEVEEVIAAHPKVLEVAAVGVPDEKSTEAVKVFIVPKDSSLTSTEVRSWCHENLVGYKIPKHVEFRKELPKTNVGKILRRELRGDQG
ncbi:MAG: AMP-binding protein [Bdellovibrionales bacterium]|nr:AMP-binding protein [Bdellovibrionales bacterium]